MKAAQSYEEILPLVELCKAGRLFEVQDWIAGSKPVNTPPSEKRNRRRPLEIAIESGFHSLVQVLLEGGSAVKDERYHALEHALSKKRLDLIELLVEFGADIHGVTMESVFETWDPKLMEYFIDRGADVESGNPLASALIQRIRTAMGVYRRYKDRFPSFAEQINIALRHHCKEGNLKWASILLYAGADPCSRGPDNPCDDPDPELDSSALEWAAFYGHSDIFKIKKIEIDPKHPDSQRLLNNACFGGSSDLLADLLRMGIDPNDQENGGSSMLHSVIGRMNWSIDATFSPLSRRFGYGTGSSKSRERIKMIHLLARHGAKWIPNDRHEINQARRSFLKLPPDFTAEFVWIISGYRATKPEYLEQLIGTSSIRAHVSKLLPRIGELIQELKIFCEGGN